ncbi:hypothetical protein HYH03_014830 [Edaphochlamys debaryana]|uniref:Fumarylacetoacetase-like C-terminal domain-containing protein n=1 Tax=Edaphochlamys debaryana TaxID=47281 RepID=A0A835XVC9_9CHLO|nr:hypothetical protein HYH03_014830 [Edaphochlamys debaryana]|eukprot:KAG2486529.1 hypothetical protein HYH03_014830 [Edaphochlamys debaryana]
MHSAKRGAALLAAAPCRQGLAKLLAGGQGLSAPFACALLRGLATSGPAAAAAGPSSSAQAPLAPRNVWCIGRNYAEHARELGNEVPTTPMIFLKAGSTAAAPGELELPSWSSDVHHEVELAVELGPDLQPLRAAVALDLTARDVQAKLKKQQWPWTLAKSFKASTPLGPPFSLKGLDPSSLTLTLDVNGKRRQTGRTADMIFPLATQVSYVLQHFPALPGDVVLTGTPPGVSQMRAGDELVARVLGPGGEVLSEGVWRVKGGPITFKASSKAEKLAREPSDADAADRSLSAYLGLPLDQYSLLDPSWISRSPARPDEFLLKVPLYDLVGVDLQPQICVRVTLDPRNSLVHFHADQFKVGDPRFDADFKLNMRATLRHKPVPTLRPLRSIRRMWARGTRRARGEGAGAAPEATAAAAASATVDVEGGPAASASRPGPAAQPQAGSPGTAPAAVPRFGVEESSGSESEGEGVVVEVEVLDGEAEAGPSSRAEGTGRAGSGPGGSGPGATSRPTATAADAAATPASTSTSAPAASSSGPGSGAGLGTAPGAAGGNVSRAQEQQRPSQVAGAGAAAAVTSVGPPVAAAAPAAAAVVPAAHPPHEVQVPQVVSSSDAGAFIEDEVLYVPASQWGRAEDGQATGPRPALAGAGAEAEAVPVGRSGSAGAAGAAPAVGPGPGSVAAALPAGAVGAAGEVAAAGAVVVEAMVVEAEVVSVTGTEARAEAASPSRAAAGASPAGPTPSPTPTASTADGTPPSTPTASTAAPTAPPPPSASASTPPPPPPPRPTPTPPPPHASASATASEDGASAVLEGSVDVAVTVMVPQALAAVPRPLLGMTGSLIARYAIASLLPSFLDLLLADYGRWSSGQTVSARAAPAGDLAAVAVANAAAMGGTPPRGAAGAGASGAAAAGSAGASGAAGAGGSGGAGGNGAGPGAGRTPAQEAEAGAVGGAAVGGAGLREVGRSVAQH